MNLARSIGLVLAWLLLCFVGARAVPSASYLVDLRSAALVLLLPWVVAFAVHGAGPSVRALRDGFASSSGDLSPERRADSAAILGSLGGLSFAAGLVGLIGTFVATLHAVAASAGTAQPADFVLALGTMVLAPIYGLLLRSFFYDPLASGLRAPVSGLGVELESS